SSTYVQTPAAAANASAMVARAYSILGAAHSMSGYLWTGSIYTSYFTCSGVVDFARGLPSWSSSPESLWAEVGSRMVYDTSKLNYGDLVFYSYAGRYPGHVGIYVGGGKIIDSIPNGGVAVRDVNYMPCIGGGPIY
ncbi:MAG: NlpC/P60 family protein, partial [Coriobacteriales bacterium]|nr:NlpC/P60 family protein [Coriobacteriales bacterium]